MSTHPKQRAGARPRLNKPKGLVMHKRALRRMRKAVKHGVADGRIRLQLDARTVITVASEAAVGLWRAKYPGLVVLHGG